MVLDAPGKEGCGKSLVVLRVHWRDIFPLLPVSIVSGPVIGVGTQCKVELTAKIELPWGFVSAQSEDVGLVSKNPVSTPHAGPACLCLSQANWTYGHPLHRNYSCPAWKMFGGYRDEEIW